MKSKQSLGELAVANWPEDEAAQTVRHYREMLEDVTANEALRILQYSNHHCLLMFETESERVRYMAAINTALPGVL